MQVDYTDKLGAAESLTSAATVLPAAWGPSPADDTVTLAVASTVAADAASGVLANDLVGHAGDVLSVTAVHVSGDSGSAAVSSNSPAVIAGTYGTLTLDADGSYSYAANATAAMALARGQAATDSFTYTVSDNHGATATAMLAITVSGTDDPPTVSVGAPSATLVEAGANAAGTSTATVSLGKFDMDGTASYDTTGWSQIDATHFSRDGTYGSAVLDTAQDTLTYTLDDSRAPTDGLAQDRSAPDVFMVTVRESDGVLTATAPVSFSIQGSNDAPIAAGDNIAIYARAAVSATAATGVLSNDRDPDAGDTLNITEVQVGSGGNSAAVSSGSPATIAGTYGTLTLNADGSYSYAATGAAAVALAQGQAATESFTYTISDNHGATGTATLSFNVTGVNDAPVAANDGVTVNGSAIVSATVAAGALSNDRDPDTGDTISVSQVNGSAANVGQALVGTYGTLTLRADGSYSYAANGAAAVALAQGQVATESFTYTVSDNHGATGTATLSVNITGVNDVPVAVNDSAAVNASATVTATAATGVLSNDRDPDTGDTLSVTAVKLSGSGSSTAVSSGSPAAIAGTYGALTLNSDGSYSYAANSAAAVALAQGQSATENFTYTVSDNHGATATATLSFNITGVNDAPVATNDSAAVNASATASATVAAGVLSNDRDPDTGDTLSVTAAKLSGSSTSTAVSSTSPAVIAGAYGTLTLNASGSYSYAATGSAAVALAQGQVATESFAYTVSDNHGATGTATLSLSVTGVNDAPVAANDSAAVNASATASATAVLSNDRDPDTGDTLSVTAAKLSGSSTSTAVSSTGPATITGSYGTLTLNADGSYSYAANSTAAVALAQGQFATESFTYTVSDNHGAAGTAALSFNVTGVNDAPVTANDGAAVNGNATVTTTAATGVLSNDHDPDTGDTVSVTAVTLTGSGTSIAVSSTSPAVIVGAYGTLTLNANGSYSYAANSPAAKALVIGQSATESFTYTEADSHGASTSATLTFTISGSDHAPTGSLNIAAPGAQDVLWYHPASGSAAEWTMSNGQYAGWTNLPNMGANSGWKVGGVGEFNPATGSAVNSPSVGQVLFADTSTLKDADGLGTFHYEWQHAPDGTSNWTDVGTDQSSYTLQASDAGTDLRVLLHYTDGAGAPETVVSNVVDPVHGVQGAAVSRPAGSGPAGSGAGATVHESTSADEVLTGGSGADTFEFAPHFGHDTVAQFTPGQDVLEFHAGIFASLDDLLRHHAAQVGSDVVIGDGVGDTLTLKGVALANLHASDFHIV